jgi:restriction system protein
MAIWLVRAGSHGEYEQKFVQEKRVYVTWEYLTHDLAKIHDRESLFALMEKI